MVEFELGGHSFDTKDLSAKQMKIMKSLFFTNELAKETHQKLNILIFMKQNLEKVWVSDFQSKIIDTYEKKSDVELKLENGKKLKVSHLNDKAKICYLQLLQVNEQISSYSNKLQILDTAKITYSKRIHQILKVTE